ncbi:MAG: hypothetical protein VSS75_002710 [Candidatus Parabeggiatoa sp.]|nr:hypothetical protein [Candidatus Parabeggiatoa sp.]
MFKKDKTGKVLLINKLRGLQADNDLEGLEEWFEVPPLERICPASAEAYENYQKRYFDALRYCAKISTPNKPSPETLRCHGRTIDFPAGFVADCCHFLKEEKIDSTGKEIKIPILLVEHRNKAGSGGKTVDNGFAAYLHLEKVDLKVCSKPYPHPVQMLCTFVDRQLERAINDAFTVLLQGEKEVPIFRWWVKSINDEPLDGIDGPSLYGVFLVGMYALTYDLTVPENRTVTCDGDFKGHLSFIDGLKEKLEAASAANKNLKVVVCQKQDESGLTDGQKKRLLKADNADELLQHFFGKRIIINARKVAKQAVKKATGIFLISIIVASFLFGWYVIDLKKEHQGYEEEIIKIIKDWATYKTQDINDMSLQKFSSHLLLFEKKNNPNLSPEERENLNSLFHVAPLIDNYPPLIYFDEIKAKPQFSIDKFSIEHYRQYLKGQILSDNTNLLVVRQKVETNINNMIKENDVLQLLQDWKEKLDEKESKYLDKTLF